MTGEIKCNDLDKKKCLAEFIGWEEMDVREPQADDPSALIGLLACPFCGGEPRLSCNEDKGKDATYWMRCNNCGAEGPVTTVQVAAAEIWNKRAG